VVGEFWHHSSRRRLAFCADVEDKDATEEADGFDECVQLRGVPRLPAKKRWGNIGGTVISVTMSS
jgi:hypothetical protein